MIERYNYNDLTWIDLQDPSQEEVREIMEEFDIRLQIAEALTKPSRKSQLEVLDESLYVVLHIPAIKHSHTNGQRQEIDFIIDGDTLITAHYDAVDPIHKFSKEFSAEAVMGRHEIGDHAGYIFYHLVKKLYKSIEHELEDVESHLDNIEKKVFAGKEKQMVAEISNVSRQLLDIERIFYEQTDTLEALQTAGRHALPDKIHPLMERLVSIHHHMRKQINWHQEIVKELRETNTSLVHTKQNEVVKVLTLMAFFTFPLALLASLFGMNTIATPVVGAPNDFWIIVGAMTVLTLLFFGYFKYRDWI